MSAAWYVTLDLEEPGFDPFVNGKALARHDGTIARLCRELGLRDLMAFFSAGADELADLDLDLDEVAAEALDEVWYAPAEGLAVVRPLIAHLEGPAGGSLPAATELVADLRELEQVLVAAERAGARWHLAVDF